MLRNVSSCVFLIVSAIIGLGAFGHGYSVHKVHEAIDRFPIDPGMSKTIYIVWYFVSGAMLAFGLILVRIWFRIRVGDTSSLSVAFLIGALYFIFGICASLYRRDDHFWVLFIILGALLLGSALVLRTQAARVG
jgi:hypothetical protein